MKSTSRPNRFAAASLVLALVLASSLSSFATANNQVARAATTQTFAVECCVILGPTVHIIEPATVVPVIVTRSSDWITFDTVQFGLSVNGGPCNFYGPQSPN